MRYNWYSNEIKEEVGYSDIMKKSADVHRWNFEPFDMIENGYEDLIEKLKTYKAEEYEAASDEDKERMVEEVLAIYRERDILPIQYYSEQGIINEIEKCIAYKAGFDGNIVSCVDGDTEYFTGNGWKKISEYDGGKVLQFNEDGTASMVTPIRYIHEEGLFKFRKYSSELLSSELTDDHTIIYKDERGYGKIKQGELVKSRGRVKVENVFDYDSMGKYTYNVDFILLFLTMLTCVVKSEEDGVVSIEAYAGSESESDLKSLSSRMDSLYEVGYKSNGRVVYFLKDRLVWSFFFGCTVPDGLYNIPKNLRMRIIWFLEEYFSGRIYISSKVSRAVSDFIQWVYCVCGVSAYIRYGNTMTEVYTSDGKVPMYMTSGFYEVERKGKYCFEVPSHMLVLRRDGKIFVTGNCGAGVGTTLCNYLFPNIFDTPSLHDAEKKGAESLYAKFHNDEYLKRAIKFCFSYKDYSPVPTSVMGGLRMVGSAPTNFRPMNAKAIYERFTPKGGIIYDYCCVDGETEYFNGREWKSLSDYTEGERVLQYNEDGSANLVLPEEYIHYENDKPFYYMKAILSDPEVVGHDRNWKPIFRDRYYCVLETCVTGNHDVVLKNNETGELIKVKQESILDDKDIFNRYHIPTSFMYDGDCYLEDSEIEDIICSIYSGNVKPSVKDRVDVSRSGQYCMSDVLYQLDIDSKCRFVGKLKEGRYLSNLLSQEDVDMVKFFISSVGEDCLLGDNKKDEYIFKDVVSVRGLLSYEYEEVNSRDKYCFVVPSHMLVLRRHGKMFITGNCGFGGRMLGALSSKNNYKYVGTDPCTETMVHLHELGEYIEMVTGREESYELHCCGSEEFRGKPNSIDFAFSSPPYFNLEIYSDEETQCFNKFPVLEDWLEGYVRATIRNIKYMLKPGKVYAVNIADFKVKGDSPVAYVDEWIRISTEEGMPLYDTVYLGVTPRAGSRQQISGELKKENILVFKKGV